MAQHLFIIEAPGKRKALSSLLWQAGLRDVEVKATIGHLGTNPERFSPLGVDAEYRETRYVLKPSKAWLAAEIGAAAKEAKTIYLASDDDQEGDVIARDTLRFCIAKEDWSRAVRVRLKALSPMEVKAAVGVAEPFEEMSAQRGDARRTLDRLIGALSSDEGAVGRVQGSMLLMLQEQQPVVGIMTRTLPELDGRGCWIARTPVYAGQAIPEDVVVDGVASVGSRREATISAHVMNHDDIVLSASLETGCSIEDVSSAMQVLYEQGKMTYPRAMDNAISRDSFRRLQVLARRNGTGFDPSCFQGVRDVSGEHAHEAPNSLSLDLPVNRNFDLLDFPDQVLVHIARNLIDCGIHCQVEAPAAADLSRLPPEVAGLAWHRIVPEGARLWDSTIKPGFQAWTPEQSLLHFMSRNRLGRPSTVVQHVQKFLGRNLVDGAFALTEKGQVWSAHIGEIFHHQNISTIIEDYIVGHREPAPTMVKEMVEMCGLSAAVGRIIQQQDIEHGETVEMQAGLVS
jgi:DNA topoisomerase-1